MGAGLAKLATSTSGRYEIVIYLGGPHLGWGANTIFKRLGGGLVVYLSVKMIIVDVSVI